MKRYRALAQSFLKASSLKKIIKLVVKRTNAMMLLLTFDVLFDTRQYGFANRNRKILLLPAKAAMDKPIFVYPVR